jgi:phage regulator Rha-like protein
MYRITRDGFTFLCMGFTGAEAAKWKEAYINAFNEMEAALQAPTTVSPAQQLKLRRAVAKIAKGHSESFSQVYHRLHDAFRISRYDQLPASQFDDALEFIEALEGEYLPKQSKQNLNFRTLCMSCQSPHNRLLIIFFLRKWQRLANAHMTGISRQKRRWKQQALVIPDFQSWISRT